MHCDEIISTNEILRRKLRPIEFEVILEEGEAQENKASYFWNERKNIQYPSEGTAIFSFAVKDNLDLEEKINVFSSYIVLEVLKGYIGSLNDKSEGNGLSIKWPNNVYYGNRKICRVLCEKIRDNIIIGIELNVNNRTLENHGIVSLYEICGIEKSVSEVIEKIIKTFKEKIEDINKEWENTLKIINENNYLKNKKINIERNGRYIEKEYRVLRIDRKGKISIIAKGDKDELKFSYLKFKIL